MDIQFTESELEAMPKRFFYPMAFVEFCESKGVYGIKREDLVDGQYLGVHQNEDGSRVTMFITEKMQPIDLAYSCTHKTRKGKELLISNMKLPDFYDVKDGLDLKQTTLF